MKLHCDTAPAVAAAFFVFFTFIAIVAMFASLAPAIIGAHARADVAEEALRAARERYPAADVRGVIPTPIQGIYEFDMGGETVFGDASARYLILGRMLDMDAASSRIARATSYERAARAGFAVHKGGAGRLVVYSDPHCPYCAQLERRLADGELDGYTVIVVLAPFLPGSAAAAARILCAEDPGRTYLNYVLEGAELPPDCGGGREQAHFSAVRDASVTGTPTFLVPSGEVFEGLPAVGRLRVWADAGQLVPGP